MITNLRLEVLPADVVAAKLNRRPGLLVCGRLADRDYIASLTEDPADPRRLHCEPWDAEVAYYTLR